MPSERAFPYVSYKFLVEMDKAVVASFSEASGLQVETEVEEYQEGGVNGYRHRLPKGSKYGNLVLKRGLTDSDALWKWHRSVVEGKLSKQRKAIALILWDTTTDDEKWRWSFDGALPVKWTGPDLKADGNTIAIESLELIHNGITSVDVKKSKSQGAGPSST